MRPSLAYTGPHERDQVDAGGITIRFLDVLAQSGLDREGELSQLPPESGNVCRPFSYAASEILKYNDSNADLFLEG